LRVLVIEDNQDDARALGWLLRADGHDTEVVTDSRVALGKALEMRPHLVIVDLAMPHVSGLDVAKQLRAADLPPFILAARTGFGDHGTRERALQAGCHIVLLKPEGLDRVVGMAQQMRHLD
jgi:CheY-like chemotaxis protein